VPSCCSLCSLPTSAPCVDRRYFNRVKTGYDWNKYNQTHYDHDNPPPKSVQGYKFNIFYPDLIDRSKTPGYVLEPAVRARASGGGGRALCNGRACTACVGQEGASSPMLRRGNCTLEPVTPARVPTPACVPPYERLTTPGPNLANPCPL
jgi:hypothetical protein